MAVEGSVPEPGAIVPHLVVRDAMDAVSFYERAFGAEVLFRSPSPSGVGEHVHLRLWGSLLQVSTEEPAQRMERVEGALLASPETLGGSTCVFQVRVEDVDAAYRKAVDEGASPAWPPTEMFWGDRYGWVRDPFGHVWALATVKEVLSVEELSLRLRGFVAKERGDSDA